MIRFTQRRRHALCFAWVQTHYGTVFFATMSKISIQRSSSQLCPGLGLLSFALFVEGNCQPTARILSIRTQDSNSRIDLLLGGCSPPTTTTLVCFVVDAIIRPNQFLLRSNFRIGLCPLSNLLITFVTQNYRGVLVCS